MVANKLRARGARGLVGLARSFTIMDKDGSGHLSDKEFMNAMRSYRIADNEE